MEIFPFIADNRIRGHSSAHILPNGVWCRRKELAVALCILLFGILLSGCMKIYDIRIADLSVSDEVDAVSGAQGRPKDDFNDSGATEAYENMAGNVSGSEEHATLLRERNRTESNSREVVLPMHSIYDWMALCYDLICKLCVSESKVRQGIFYYRLQSDDEEAPAGPKLCVA